MYVNIPYSFKHYGTVSSLILFQCIPGYARSHLSPLNFHRKSTALDSRPPLSSALGSATFLALLEMACTVSLPVTSRALVLPWVLLAVAPSCEFPNVYCGRLVEPRTKRIIGLWLYQQSAKPVTFPSPAMEKWTAFWLSGFHLLLAIQHD